MPTHYSVGLLIIAIIDVLDGWQFSTLSRVKLLKTALGIIIIEAYDTNLVQANLFINILFLRNTGCTGVCMCHGSRSLVLLRKAGSVSQINTSSTSYQYNTPIMILPHSQDLAPAPSLYECPQCHFLMPR